MKWNCKLKRKHYESLPPSLSVLFNRIVHALTHNFHFIISLVFCTSAQTGRKPNSNRKHLFVFSLVIHCNFRALMISSTLSTALRWNNAWMLFFLVYFTFEVSTWVFDAVKWSSIIFLKKEKTNECIFRIAQMIAQEKEEEERVKPQLNFTKAI